MECHLSSYLAFPCEAIYKVNRGPDNPTCWRQSAVTAV